MSTLEELPAEDGTIRNEIAVLDSYIDQHVVKFYRSESDSRGTPLRRRIAETVVHDIIEGNMNGIHPPALSLVIIQTWTQAQIAERTVAADLSRNLEQYAKTPSDAVRHSHIVDLCEVARGIGQMTRGHPSRWTFGGFGQGIQFPAVFRDGEEVMPPDIDL